MQCFYLVHYFDPHLSLSRLVSPSLLPATVSVTPLARGHDFRDPPPLGSHAWSCLPLLSLTNTLTFMQFLCYTLVVHKTLGYLITGFLITCPVVTML